MGSRFFEKINGWFSGVLVDLRNERILLFNDWKDSSLVAFERHSGFEEMKLPRYFVPLTLAGKIGLGLRLERFRSGMKEGLPDSIRKRLKMMRKRWLEFQTARPLRPDRGDERRTL